MQYVEIEAGDPVAIHCIRNWQQEGRSTSESSVAFHILCIIVDFPNWIALDVGPKPLFLPQSLEESAPYWRSTVGLSSFLLRRHKGPYVCW